VVISIACIERQNQIKKTTAKITYSQRIPLIISRKIHYNDSFKHSFNFSVGMKINRDGILRRLTIFFLMSDLSNFNISL
jgi:hypothetical protein